MRDTILRHTLEAMDVHYISLTEQSLKQDMAKYTARLDSEIEVVSVKVDYGID